MQQKFVSAASQGYEWNWKSDEKEFRRAIELNPGYAAARQRYGWYLFALARHDESLDQLKRALKDDPLSVWIHSNIGCARYYARRYDDAIRHLAETLEMDANYLPAHVFLGWLYEQKRMFDEAISEFEKSIALSSGASLHLASLAHAYAVSGRTQEARSLVEELTGQSQQKYVASYWMGRSAPRWVIKKRRLDGWKEPMRSAMAGLYISMSIRAWTRCVRMDVLHHCCVESVCQPDRQLLSSRIVPARVMSPSGAIQLEEKRAFRGSDPLGGPIQVAWAR